MKLKQAHLSLFLAVGVFGIATTYAQQVSKPAASGSGSISVNGVLIPQNRIDMFVKQAAQQGQPNTPELVNAVRDTLINQEILTQAAVKKGLDKNTDVAAQLAFTRQRVLAEAYVQEHVKSNPIKDETLKTEYEKIKIQMGDKEYKVRHILVDKEDEAKDIIAQLNKGAEFNKLAKEKTKDAGSKENGGDLEWSPPGRYVPPFAEALTKLPKGQITQEPVKTNFGYHVIKLEDVRDLKAPGFDEVKDRLRQPAQQEQVRKLIAELRSKAKIEEK